MIERRKPLYSPAFAGFASACACASFVFLLGGGPYDMIGAFVAPASATGCVAACSPTISTNSS